MNYQSSLEHSQLFNLKGKAMGDEKFQWNAAESAKITEVNERYGGTLPHDALHQQMTTATGTDHQQEAGGNPAFSAGGDICDTDMTKKTEKPVGDMAGQPSVAGLMLDMGAARVIGEGTIAKNAWGAFT